MTPSFAPKLNLYGLVREPARMMTEAYAMLDRHGRSLASEPQRCNRSGYTEVFHLSRRAIWFDVADGCPRSGAKESDRVTLRVTAREVWNVEMDRTSWLEGIEGSRGPMLRSVPSRPVRAQEVR